MLFAHAKGWYAPKSVALLGWREYDRYDTGNANPFAHVAAEDPMSESQLPQQEQTLLEELHDQVEADPAFAAAVETEIAKLAEELQLLHKQQREAVQPEGPVLSEPEYCEHGRRGVDSGVRV